jgi:hypothetical protein
MRGYRARVISISCATRRTRRYAPVPRGTRPVTRPVVDREARSRLDAGVRNHLSLTEQCKEIGAAEAHCRKHRRRGLRQAARGNGPRRQRARRRAHSADELAPRVSPSARPTLAWGTSGTSAEGLLWPYARRAIWGGGSDPNFPSRRGRYSRGPRLTGALSSVLP